jgi:hypothetical protein
MTNPVEILKPAHGLLYYLHGLLRAALPLLVLVFVRANVPLLAVAVILLSKWRMLVVRPRYWAASVRSNAIDIIVGLSFVVFMAHTTSGNWQLMWAVLYGLWLVVLKPLSRPLAVSIQALIGQSFGLVALFMSWPDASLFGYVIGVGVICYLAARHFVSSFDEPYAPMFANFWAYFSASLMWVLGHWLLFYGVVSQPTLLLTVLSLGMGGIYYLDQTDRLSSMLRRNFVFIVVAIVVVVVRPLRMEIR